MKSIFSTICFFVLLASTFNVQAGNRPTENTAALMRPTSTNLLASTFNVQTGNRPTENTAAFMRPTSAKKLFILRVQLTGRNDLTTIPLVSNGLTVYNLATAGAGINEVYPGLYYFDGKVWQRVEEQPYEASVEFSTANPNAGSPQFTPNIPANSNYLYVSTVDGSEWTWDGTKYVYHSGGSKKEMKQVPNQQEAPY